MTIDKFKLRRLHREGATNSELASAFVVSESTIDRRLRAEGLYRKRGFSDVKRHAVLRDYTDGGALKRIAFDHGVSMAAICLWASEANLPKRKPRK